MIRFLFTLIAAASFLLLTTGCQTELAESTGSPFKAPIKWVRKPWSSSPPAPSASEKPQNKPSFTGKCGTFTCGGESLSFTIGVERTQFRGTALYLPEKPGKGEGAFPPKMFNQVAAPLLSGAKAGRTVRTILLDPGHGGKDQGTFSVLKQREKDLNLALAMELRTQLEKQGFQVRLTRENDHFIPLDERSPMAKKYKADIFLSVHHNAAGSRKVKGFETFACTPGAGVKDLPESTSLAWNIQRQIAPAGSGMDRGVRFQNFVVLRTSEVPAVLIEAGFLSNPDDAAKAADPEARRRFSAAVARGVREFSGPEPKKAVPAAADKAKKQKTSADPEPKAKKTEKKVSAKPVPEKPTPEKSASAKVDKK